MNPIEILLDRQDAVGTDQPIDLWKKRYKRYEVNNGEAAKEQRSGHILSVGPTGQR